MSTPVTDTRSLNVEPARGLRELSIPCDPAGNLGVSGIHYNRVLGATEILAGLPLALANNTGAVYLSTIHGGLGSDVRNLRGAPAAGFNPNVPAFPNPEVTGYYIPPSASAPDPLVNGFNNTEKIQRTADQANGPGGATNNATIWQGTQGRDKLNFSLWISGDVAAYMQLELYRDLNAQDKVAGAFGAGTGALDPRNAQLVGSWVAYGAFKDQNKPNFATSFPFHLPAGCNLYLLFRNMSGFAANRAVGSIWLS